MNKLSSIWLKRQSINLILKEKSNYQQKVRWFLNIFDDIPRDYLGPARHTECTYEWYNRSARPSVERIRRNLQEWFKNYPKDSQDELCKRLGSVAFASAFFELFLHELLLKLGCIVTVHPEMEEGNGCRPEFLATSEDETQFYLEATHTYCESEKTKGGKNLIDGLSDYLDKNLNNPDFLIGIDIMEFPNKTIPLKEICKFIQKRMEGLDPERVTEAFGKPNKHREFEWIYKSNGWEIGFLPIPKSPEFRGICETRTVGMWEEPAVWSDAAAPIKKSIIKKSKKYGKHELPFIVAVNILDEFIRETDVVDALFGGRKYMIRMSATGNKEMQVTRELDGVWTSPRGARYTRVSAVLIAFCLGAHNIPRAKLRVYLNPWAEKSCPSNLCQLPYVIAEEGKLKYQNGKTLDRIFDLPLNWPSRGK